jgi:hypothetical protein
MMLSIKNLIGYKIGALDGEIGKVKDFYFEDKTWSIRYLIVETGSLFFRRKVMISTQSLLHPEWEKETFLVDLTIQQIENSPAIDAENSVSRHQETELNKHYSWIDYWSIGVPIDKEEAAGSHLYSTDKVEKYHVNVTDGEVGKMDDFLMDESNWKLNFIVVDTFTHSPAKIVLVPIALVKEINQEAETVSVEASAEQIKSQPEYHFDTVNTKLFEI